MYAGITYLNCIFNLGQIPHDKIMRSMDSLRRRS
jgi:hypothetical protein